jgi:hypothetical protein
MANRSIEKVKRKMYSTFLEDESSDICLPEVLGKLSSEVVCLALASRNSRNKKKTI